MMRVALITPFYNEVARGNAVTVRRLEHYLRNLGCDLRVFALDELPVERAVSEVTAGGFDLCHAFHAHLGGTVARAISEKSGIPYLVTITGSDVYEALHDGRRGETLDNLSSASSVVVFHKIVASRLASQASFVTERIAVISQGVDLPAIEDISEMTGESDEFIFLLPAGIRPVKDLFAPLKPLAELYRKHPEIRLRIAGPVIDHVYASQLFDLLPDYPFARYLGVVEHSEMDNLYRKAAVVVNSSLFEGGMANSLLEAMAWGKPVLASDMEGNRSLISDGVNGLLYIDSADFALKAELLLTNPTLRQSLGNAGLRLVQEKNSPVNEATAYLSLYGEAVKITNSRVSEFYTP